MFEFQGKILNYNENVGAPVPQGIYEESATATAPVGTVRRTDGRTYIYSKNGGVALVAGNLIIQATPVANHQNLAVAAVTKGSSEVTVTLGATAATVNQYENGWLVVNDVAGEGSTYRIKANPAADASASMVVTLDDSVVVALTASSEVCLIPADYVGVVVSIADQADRAAGVAPIPVTASYYFWLQTGGVSGVLADEAIAQGLAVTIGSSTVGAVEGADAAGEPVVGFTVIAAVDTEYRPVDLTILK